MTTEPETAPTEPGVYTISNETYHTGPGVSKSTLWKLHKKTPYHVRFSEPTDETASQRFGSAAHTAVLEPGLFEPRYTRGPDVRKNTNEWKAACKIAEEINKECLPPDEYDNALRLRDVLHRNPLIQKLTAGTPAYEQSAYWIDETTGELCKCRPDIFNHDLAVMGDLKSTVDASEEVWKKRCGDFGYHAQEPYYSQGWAKATGTQVLGFIFIAVEKDPPFAYALYELEPSAYAEGDTIMHSALDQYHDCMRRERLLPPLAENASDEEREAHVTALLSCWPSYPGVVQSLDIPSYMYKYRMSTLQGMKP